jgi:hypothetical protein
MKTLQVACGHGASHDGQMLPCTLGTHEGRTHRYEGPSGAPGIVSASERYTLHTDMTMEWESDGTCDCH